MNVRGAQFLRQALIVSVVLGAGCAPFPTLKPSHERNWRPEQAILPYAKFKDHQVKIYNVRDNDYRTPEDYTVRHEDRVYDLNQLKTVDFIVVPFPEAPDLAHTMLSFGFDERDWVVISIEARREQGEEYSPVGGALRQYELMYVVASERDAIGVRANYRNNDVYLYRSTADPARVKSLFLDMLRRTNEIRGRPEFYDTITNNCTSNIVAHVNRLQPGAIPRSIHVLLPGHADRLAYDLGLLDRSIPFETLKQRSRINALAGRYSVSADFSRKIRAPDAEWLASFGPASY